MSTLIELFSWIGQKPMIFLIGFAYGAAMVGMIALSRSPHQ